MSPFLNRNHRLLFYGTWLLLGLMQAALTELQDDEAYYWVYSRFLDWGYFDHPPLTGLLVKMGYAIFPNELGVRLFPLLLNILSLFIIERLTTNKNPILFYAIALSIAVLQITGFVAVPDIPLIFFTALFFWFYKKFLGNNSVLNSILLGLSIALLFYSKYHAVLIVAFTLLSNLKLFAKPKVYLVAVVALILFLPHLWWQYQHDWVSFKYHLFESNVNKYKFSFTTDYIVGQLLLPGPIAGFLILPAAFLYNCKDKTERALKFTMIGIYAFFLVSSFRGRVEANWTSPVLVSLMVLSHQFFNEHMKWRNWLFKLLPITLLLVLFGRIVMIEDIIPVKELKNRYHAWKEWPKEMKEKTKGYPIVFSNSYQRASKYWFYSGQPTYSQNWYRERKNNYNFWPIEDSMLGKPNYFLDKYDLFRFPDSLETPIGWVGYRFDSSLASFAKIEVVVKPSKIAAKEGESITLNCHFEIPPHYADFISKQESLNDTTRIGIYTKYGWFKDVPTSIILKEVLKNPDLTITVDPGVPKGNYFMRFSISEGETNPTHNSDKIELIIE
jgi:hypothetical protein